MNAWNELIARLTQRLGVDPELQRDVAAELRAHLEDSAAEFRRGGQSPSDADASAAKALGDAGELADDLWNANRRRMKWRGIARWILQLATLPAAMAVLIAVGLGLYGTSQAPLSPDQQLILNATSTDEAPDTTRRAKKLVDRWPDNPVYFANYASMTVMADPQSPSSSTPGKEERTIDPQRLAKTLAILDRGEQLEPDNGFYPISKACLLLIASTKLAQDPALTYEVTDREGKIKDKPCCTVTITDPGQFDLALKELRRGLSLPRYTNHGFEMLDIQLRQLPPPHRLNEYLRNMGINASYLLPSLGYQRTAVKILGAYAIEQARQGKRDKTKMILDLANRKALRFNQSPTLIELLVVQASRELTLGHSIKAYEILGQKDSEQQARSKLTQQNLFWWQLWNNRKKDIDVRNTGMYWQVMLPNLPGYAENLNFEPMRTAEKMAYGQTAMLLLLSATTVLMFFLWIGSFLNLAFSPKDKRPLLLLLPWATLGSIFGWAVALPLAIYAFYACFISAGRDMGLNYTFDKTALEWVMLALTIFVLLMGLTGSAIRRRAEAIGLEVPPRLRWKNRWLTLLIGGVLVLAALVYVVGWEAGFFRPGPYSGIYPLVDDSLLGSSSQFNPFSPKRPGFILATALTLFVLAAWLRETLCLRKPQWKLFRLSLRRSLVPVVATAVIVIGLLCGFAMAKGEQFAVVRLQGNASLGSLSNEVELSDYRLLRDRLAQEYKALGPLDAAAPPTTQPH